MAGFLDDYLSENALAKQLDLTVWALRAWTRRQYGPPRHKFGRKVYYRTDEVRAFLEEKLG